MSEINNRVSVSFKGLPMLRDLRAELERLEKYMPGYTRLAGLEDNDSANPELREISLNFETERSAS